jgi:hypothetical protein
MVNARYLRPGLDFAVGRAIEECGEVCAALGKTIRWGWYSVNPELPLEKQEQNIDWVRREIDDAYEALSRLETEIRDAHHRGLLK